MRMWCASSRRLSALCTCWLRPVLSGLVYVPYIYIYISRPSIGKRPKETATIIIIILPENDRANQFRQIPTHNFYIAPYTRPTPRPLVHLMCVYAITPACHHFTPTTSFLDCAHRQGANIFALWVCIQRFTPVKGIVEILLHPDWTISALFERGPNTTTAVRRTPPWPWPSMDDGHFEYICVVSRAWCASVIITYRTPRAVRMFYTQITGQRSSALMWTRRDGGAVSNQTYVYVCVHTHSTARLHWQ